MGYLSSLLALGAGYTISNGLAKLDVDNFSWSPIQMGFHETQDYLGKVSAASIKQFKFIPRNI